MPTSLRKQGYCMLLTICPCHPRQVVAEICRCTYNLTVYAASETDQRVGAERTVLRLLWVKLGANQTPSRSDHRHQFLLANPLLLHQILRGDTVFRLGKIRLLNLDNFFFFFLEALLLAGRPKICKPFSYLDSFPPLS